MRWSDPIRKALLITAGVVFCATSALAQYGYDPEPERWHLTGSAGVELQGSDQSIVPSQVGNSQLFPLGDLRLNADGFLLDPRFLHISGGFNFQKGVNESDRGSIDNGGLGLAVSTAFLPRSHIPLRVTYTRNTFGLTGLGVNQDSADSRLDVEWTEMFPSLPRFTVGLQHVSDEVRVPQSFSDRSFQDTGLNLGISDLWKGWEWSANGAIEGGSTSGIAELGQPTSFDNSTRAAMFNLGHSFWQNNARLTWENRWVSQEQNLGPNGNSDSTELTSHANLNLRLSTRWSAQAGYAFSQVDFNSSNFSANIPGAGQTQVISLTSSTAHALSGRLEYHPKDWLRLSQELRTTLTSPIEQAAESRTSQTESVSTVTAEHRVHGFDLMGSYSGRYQLSSTTLDRSPDSWSNGFNARVGWGSTRTVRLTGVYEKSRLNLVELIGGYTDQQRARLEAETYRLKFVRLRASVEQYRIDILNVSGKTDNQGTNYAATAEHRLFSVTFAKSLGEGAGALFPDNLIPHQFVIIPLPVAQLVATPLLDRTVQSRSLIVIARPNRRLQAGLSWRKEKDLLFAANQFFDVLQFDARYRLGKVSVEGGYSRNLTDVYSPLTMTGDRLTRWYVRIARDFTIF